MLKPHRSLKMRKMIERQRKLSKFSPEFSKRLKRKNINK